MDEFQHMVAGGYYACVAIFAVGGALLAGTTGLRVYAYFAIHALAIGLLALTFPPIAPSENAIAFWHQSTRMAAEGSVVATAGLLMAHLVLPVSPRWVHIAVRAIAPVGVLLSINALWFPAFPHATSIYGAVVLITLLVMLTALIITSVTGSREARFLLVAFTPLIVVGSLAAAHEALSLPSLTFYAEGMLAGFIFELLFVFANLARRLRDAMRDRDLARIEADYARQMSETDPLTGLPNRRVFDRQIKTDPATRFAAIAVLDCDRFKMINDCFGHSTGDDVLRQVGRELRAIDGMAMRIGGEEFGLLLAGDDWPQELERIRLSIPAAVMKAIPDIDMPVTVSIGAITFAAASSAELALLRADEALYMAKQAGRDRVVLHEVGRDFAAADKRGIGAVERLARDAKAEAAKAA